MPDRFFGERQPAAVLKHEILRRYLPVFVRKVGSRSKDRRIAYLDGYAGPGYYDDGSPGSPAVAIETAQIVADAVAGDRIDGYFVERDSDSVDALLAHLGAADLPWIVWHGEVQDAIDDVMGHIDPRTGLFAFLDPFGLGLPLADLESKILSRAGRMVGGYRTGAATEVLLNFSFPGMRRNAGHLMSEKTGATYLKARQTILDRVDGAMGGPWWQKVWRTGAEDREDQILEGYRQELMRLPGGWGVFTVPVSDRWMGNVDYCLLLLTQHRDGMWEFHQALSSALEAYRTHCFNLTGEIDFEPLDVREAKWIAEIEANIERLLDGGAFVVDRKMSEVYGEALGFAREKHVRRAIKNLHAAGKTSTNGVGEIQTMRVKP